MPTWYRAPSAPAANRPAHGTPQQAPGSGTAAHASNRQTGRQGFRFREKWEQSANNPLPTSPENGAGFSANTTGQQFLFPLPAISEPHDTCLPTNPLRQFPHRPKAESLASASFPVRNISAPCAHHPAANRPASGTRQRNGRACLRRPSSARAAGSRCATFRPDVASFRGYANGMPPRVQVSRIARKTQFA